jgi:hypothetical protein
MLWLCTGLLDPCLQHSQCWHLRNLGIVHNKTCKWQRKHEIGGWTFHRMLYTYQELIYFVKAICTYIKTGIHINLYVTHENAFYESRHFYDTDDCICMAVRMCSKLQPVSQIVLSFCLCCHIFRLCCVKTDIGIPDGNVEYRVRAFL